ncbi:DUF2182 domain-containing protein [Mesorhizobium sp. LSJC264A00]|uniref:copper chaperone n=1 Tax=unclassified Mesorhizobium TaxID=325217 RepID=UPI0012ECB5EB|nr:DUF2182 domain-containing protein [Mesorhizobium sp. LSJC264A00]
MVSLALAAGLAWIVLAVGRESVAIPAICSAAVIWSAPSADLYLSVFAVVSPLTLAAGWVVMVCAMMLPTVYDPLIHVRQQNFRHLRPWCTLLFIGGYIAVWTLAGVIFLNFALAVQMALHGASWLLILSLVVASIWQISPWKQMALNKCHHRPSMAAFAPTAYHNAFSLGVQHCLWCIANCWALMLMTLFAPAYHVAIMAIVAFCIWAERIEAPRAPGWQIRVPTKALRLIALIARTPVASASKQPANVNC